MKYRVYQFCANTVCFFTDHKKSIASLFLLVLVGVITFNTSYAFVNKDNIENNELVKSNIEINVIYMVENLDEHGRGTGSYTSSNGVPSRDYEMVKELSGCNNNATFDVNEEGMIKVMSSNKTTCEFYYDKE